MKLNRLYLIMNQSKTQSEFWRIKGYNTEQSKELSDLHKVMQPGDFIKVPSPFEDWVF